MQHRITPGTDEKYKVAVESQPDVQHLQAKHYNTFVKFRLFFSTHSLCFSLKKVPAWLRSPFRACTTFQQFPRNRSLPKTLLRVRRQKFTWPSVTRMPQASRQATTSTQTKRPKTGDARDSRMHILGS